eukprot:155646_1
MSAKQDIPLIIDHQNNNQENVGSEVMLTVFDGAPTKPTNYDSIKEQQILMPGDELMTRDEVPKYPIAVYILYYLFMFAAPVILTFISFEYVEDVDSIEYVSAMIAGGIFLLIVGWIIGAVFYNLCGMPSNYTRKIGHLFFFMFPLIFAGGVGTFDNWEDGSDTLVDINAAYENIIFDVLWAMWQSQLFIIMMARPSRMCSNYLCGNTRSKNPCRWINCCENTMDAFERKEDRPNHLLWLNSQGILYYIFLFGLSFWWSELDTGVFVLIPALVSGLGDGLAEPVGVKFGRNGCGTGKDCTYKTHGCCTKYDYVRSVPGSSMVLLSGYIGVALCYNQYTMWQFIIAMLIVPPVGCITEAKAPHTMDNPFIALIVGSVATVILYFDF